MSNEGRRIVLKAAYDFDWISILKVEISILKAKIMLLFYMASIYWS